ncbi:MAG: hypothetical protein RMK49_15725 [Abditibacteriales bacterium]|nr:hypothetical protein [Abditibacteriales bacterium]
MSSRPSHSISTKFAGTDAETFIARGGTRPPRLRQPLLRFFA